MSTFSVTVKIGPIDGARYAEVDALVDTGATTTVIPASILRGLGIEPAMRKTFEYADGNRVNLDMGKASAIVEGRETPTWVIFGAEDGGALLGAYTLEGTFLAVDPYNERLIPVDGLLKPTVACQWKSSRNRNPSVPSPLMGEG